MDSQRVACIIPFLDEARHLPAVLASLAAQTIERARLYVIGIDNGSSDGSDALFEGWLATEKVAGKLVREPVRSIPRAVNAGIAQTRETDVVVRLDAHTVYAPDYLAVLTEALATLPADVWCVGGAPQPHPAVDGYSQALVAAMYANPVALGPADFRRDHRTAIEVSTVYIGAWRPGVLQRLGGFDERWAANEDCELTERIRATGARIYRVPADLGVIVTRGAVATVRQRARYGYWRMQTLRRYPRAVRARHVLPPLALLAALALAASRWRRLLLPLCGLYAVATIRGRRAGEAPSITAGTLVFFPLLQASYATGLLAGLVHVPPALRRRAMDSQSTKLRGGGAGPSQ